MRILLSRSSTDQVIGGAELSARDITRSLSQLGHQCTLITNIRKPAMVKGLPAKAVRYSTWARFSHSKISKLLYPFLLILMSVRYFIYIVSFKPDVICPQSREDQIIFTFLGKLLKIPVVWRDPGDLVPQLQHPLRSVIQRTNRRIQMNAIHKATHIFTLNKDDRETLLKLLPGLSADHISVVGSNIMFDDYTVEKKPKKEQPVIVGAIGNLSAHKGFDVLIRAFMRLDQKNTELHIVGDGAEKKALEKLARSASNIRFLGYQTDTSRYLNTFDIFVQPSYFEGWGRTVKEAKLFGIATIGSNVGGIARQIEDEKTGLLFTAGSVDELTKHLEKLTRDGAYRTKLGKAAEKAAHQEGDWNTTVAQKIIPLFTSALQTKK